MSNNAPHNDVYIYTINEAGRSRRLATLLPEEITRQHGLKTYAIVGEFTQAEGEEETFKVNPAYIEFLSWAIAKHAPHCPSLQAKVAEKQNGNLLINDLRGHLSGAEITEEDVIGMVEIKDGKLIRYAGNKNYRPFSQHGFMLLEPWLNQKIREELMEQVSLPGDVE